MPTFLRVPYFLGTALVLAAASPVHAQVTLHLTTPEQGNCVAVTDAQGLQLVPGGTDLQASGVTLTGTACGGSGSSDFGVTVGSANPTPVAGTPFNVSWTATEDATRCTYGGTAGATGWPVGQEACSGAGCASPATHTNAVTVPAAGDYSFSVTCTNATGFAQASVSATAPQLPPQPSPFNLTAPVSATVGTAIQVSWSVTGAQSCSGTAKRDGVAIASLPGWTDVTTSTSPRSINFAQSGSYELRLDCQNTAGHTLSNPATIAVTTSNSDSCPAGRQETANVCYTYVTSGSSCRNNADVTKFENIWGYFWDQTPPAHISTQLLFPGYNYYAVVANWDKTKYIAAKFTVPATGLATNAWGKLTHGETFPGANLDATITSACGNFDFDNIDQRCKSINRGTGQGMGSWRLPTSNQTGACPLTPGQTYFINVRMNNPPASNQDCNAATCRVSMNNNYTLP